MKASHVHLPARAAVRWWLAALSFCVFQVNAATPTATVPFQNFMRNVTGANSATVAFSGSGTPVLAAAPASLGGTAGWSTASNFASRSTAAGGFEMATSGAVGVGKYSVPATLTGAASKTASLAAMRATFLGVARAGSGPLGMLFLLKEFTDLMASANIKRNPDTSNTDKPFLTDGEQIVCPTPPPSVIAQNYTALACVGQTYTYQSPSVCMVLCRKGNGDEMTLWSSAPVRYPDGVPAAWDELNHRWRNANFQPETLPKFIDETEKIRNAHPNAGIEPFKIELDEGQKASGPATLPSAAPTTTTTTKTNPDGSTTTTTTTTTKTPSVTYTGDKIEVTEKDKTTTEEKTCAETGTCTTTKPKPDEDTEKPATEETDLCKLHPEILACKEIDVPEGEIPRSQKTITYAPEDPGFGGGSCPPDRAIGTEYTFSYAHTCNLLTSYVKPMVLVIAAFSALMIVFGIRSEL